jgi:cellulose synthase/poly-beta-1,6-N-acetylglucosamine synthase-like glycosyltransferase
MIIEQLIFGYFTIAVTYTLSLAIAGLFKKKAVLNKKGKLNKIALLVPVYKEDEVILQVAQSHLRQSYPSDQYDVIVIADQLQPNTIDTLRSKKIQVIEVKFDKSTKAKSLNAAFGQLSEKQYEIALICDADNVLEVEFLHKINSVYNNGHHVIQAKRVAKNLNTSYAVLDGASEIINNHLFRKGYNVLGLSSSLIGSGMAFNFKMIKQLFASIEAVGGFDKILQLKLVEAGYTIYFLENAVVFDEKIASSEAFEKQRRRWLHTQFSYPLKHFIPGLKQLLKGHLDYVNLALIYYLFPTRVFLLGTLAILATVATALHFIIQLPYEKWWLLFGLYAFALLICLPKKFFNGDLLKAVLSIPRVFIRMFLLLFKLKGANKNFIHTTHSNSKLENNIFNTDDTRS